MIQLNFSTFLTLFFRRRQLKSILFQRFLRYVIVKELLEIEIHIEHKI